VDGPDLRRHLVDNELYCNLHEYRGDIHEDGYQWDFDDRNGPDEWNILYILRKCPQYVWDRIGKLHGVLHTFDHTGCSNLSVGHQGKSVCRTDVDRAVKYRWVQHHKLHRVLHSFWGKYFEQHRHNGHVKDHQRAH
jgi:hypothetical protein